MKADSTVVNGWAFLVTALDGRPRRHHDGFYHRDTRHLDTYSLDAAETNLESVELVHPRPGERLIETFSPLTEGARRLHLHRHQVVDDGLYEQLTATNLSRSPMQETLVLHAGTRFDDIFEVRGHGAARPRTIDASADEQTITFSYDPADIEKSWETTIATTGGTVTSVADGDAGHGTIEIPLELDSGESTSVTLGVTSTGEVPNPAGSFDAAREATAARQRSWVQETNQLTREGWHDVLEESRANLLELTLETPHGPVFAAGTPWFDTVFGRDSLIAAYQSLPLSTTAAKATCRVLAEHQAEAHDAFRDAEPGKIMHEIRFGESTLRGESPHGPYYGTVDATALFVVLAHETWQLTGDHEFATSLYPAIERALEWLVERGDRGDDEFLDYPADAHATGLTHQAWKDSGDGIMTPEGTHPDGPLAVAEVQGYYYDALLRGAHLVDEIADESAYATDLTERAGMLAEAFDDAFWMPDESFYAVALNGEGKQVQSVTTNPGHCLWSGIVPESRAQAVVERLLAPDMFSGWGIRTLSTDHDVYNPQSYHLGSIWPHDNSLVALGMARYGHQNAAQQVGEALVDAARARGNDRLPELFAGFPRDDTPVPIEYGAACEPQAWAAAAPIACYRAIEGTVEPEIPLEPRPR